MRDFSTDAYPDRRSTVSTLFRSSSTFILSPVPLDYLIHIHFSPISVFSLYTPRICVRNAGKRDLPVCIQFFRRWRLNPFSDSDFSPSQKKSQVPACDKKDSAGCIRQGISCRLSCRENQAVCAFAVRRWSRVSPPGCCTTIVCR